MMSEEAPDATRQDEIKVWFEIFQCIANFINVDYNMEVHQLEEEYDDEIHN